jgi:hypothetical protein
MAEVEEKKDTETKFEGGELLQCGATDYWAVGRTKDVREKYPCLMVPSRFKSLEVS